MAGSLLIWWNASMNSASASIISTLATIVCLWTRNGWRIFWHTWSKWSKLLPHWSTSTSQAWTLRRMWRRSNGCFPRARRSKPSTCQTTTSPRQSRRTCSWSSAWRATKVMQNSVSLASLIRDSSRETQPWQVSKSRCSRSLSWAGRKRSRLMGNST